MIGETYKTYIAEYGIDLDTLDKDGENVGMTMRITFSVERIIQSHEEVDRNIVGFVFCQDHQLHS